MPHISDDCFMPPKVYSKSPSLNPYIESIENLRFQNVTIWKNKKKVKEHSNLVETYKPVSTRIAEYDKNRATSLSDNLLRILRSKRPLLVGD